MVRSTVAGGHAADSSSVGESTSHSLQILSDERFVAAGYDVVTLFFGDRSNFISCDFFFKTTLKSGV